MHSTPSDAHDAALQTIGDWIRFAASRFNAGGLFFGHGTASAADEARALVFCALDLDFDSPEYFYTCRITRAEQDRLDALINKRLATRLPLPYLIGRAWFCGLEFFVDERVLIPRSPIAELIEHRFEPWLDVASPTVLDMCTGSGCIGIACAAFMPAAHVDIADSDADALAVAAINIERHGMTGQVVPHQSDLFAQLPPAQYDLIVCNPPYVPPASVAALPAEYGHEPAHALLADDDGLEFIHRLLQDAPAFLTADGVLVVEVGESAAAFSQVYPDLPVTWCDFARGGEGVFVLKAEDLRAYLV